MYSVDESDLQHDEVAIIKVFVKFIYIYIVVSGWILRWVESKICVVKKVSQT